MILVDIRIPPIDMTVDYMLDENATIEQITYELIEMVGKKVNSEVHEKQDFGLFSLQLKKELSPHQTLADYGISDGSTLILV
ncbi:EsaB/YukD family protein [Sharpea azabuensis]